MARRINSHLDRKFLVRCYSDNVDEGLVPTRPSHKPDRPGTLNKLDVPQGTKVIDKEKE